MVSIPPHKLDILLDTHGTYSSVWIALSQDTTSDADALDSKERLVSSLLYNSPLSAEEVLRNPLLLDPSFKERLWKPWSKDLYKKCDPNGTCGYQFLYQMYLRGLRNHSSYVIPVLLSSAHFEGFRSYLEGLVLQYEQSVSHSDSIRIIWKYLKRLERL